MVTALNEKGMPTELVHTLMRPPFSGWIFSARRRSKNWSASPLVRKYNQDIDREGAHEILMERMEEGDARQEREKKEKPRETVLLPGPVGSVRSPLLRKL